ncbi:biotin transporter BioY [Tuberibacillus sp. Marseille-P3662]|uniref:biotin transporter BioY n=1 Tax=Tuberibacillus sp. Marseille-P3662 TaxID=1965358 RepID=UPI000A1C97CD|nr:biotin transporter BioY [Tuberibacillus sp. Marseille-P3662]
MRLRAIIYTALFTAFMAALGVIPGIPLPFIPVPITLQTLGVMLAGNVLGARKGFMSLFLFVILVAIGVPILSGFRGGMGVLLGYSGGYVLSYPIAAFVIGGLSHICGAKKIWKMIMANVVGGIFVIYICGISYAVVMTQTEAIPFMLSNLAFLPGDLVKVMLSSWLAMRLYRITSSINYDIKERKQAG